MHTNRSFLHFAGRAAAFTLLMAGTASLLQGQQSSQGVQSAPAPVLMAAAAPLNLAVPADASSSSNSSSSSDATTSRFDLSLAALDSSQPPPRRRYGRPNYADSHTNPDGSPKWTFMVGGGLASPVNDTGKYLTPNFVFQGGGGRNFSKKVGILFQYDYNRFGMQGSTLHNQQALYNSYCTSGQCALITNLDGGSHVWSFTLNPIFTFYNAERESVYFVAGVGFYHKTANFNVPTTGVYCDPYYGCYTYAANQTIDAYTSNAVGFNGGMGLTYKPSQFAGERFYLEARFVFVDNSSRAASATNLYPPNANQTYYVPVTFGLRF
jgi:hypothetical protein